ncbi:MAG: phosphate ABC transporter substrate-binding protein PstS [Gemmatimonadota bacterium]
MKASRLAAIVLLSVACGGSEQQGSDGGATRAGGVDLNGAGATFPYPIYSKWFSDYAGSTGIRINYQSIGSGGGIKQLSENTVDFGASDSPMTAEEMTAARGGRILHFPTVLGSVVVTYNLPGLAAPLKLTGELISEIFLGRIVKWNDPRIAGVNVGVNLPDTDVLVSHRSDGSGTTYVFTDFLSAVSPAWRAGPGRGKTVAWPVGLGGRGNEGVAGTVKQTPGAVGYVELVYAKQNQLQVAHVQNAAGQFVEPTIAATTTAAESALPQMGPDSDYRVSIVNAAGEAAYPIASFTWLLVYENQSDSTKARKLTDFMRWAYSEGQASAEALGYAPLPGALASELITRLSSIRTSTAQ